MLRRWRRRHALPQTTPTGSLQAQMLAMLKRGRLESGDWEQLEHAVHQLRPSEAEALCGACAAIVDGLAVPDESTAWAGELRDQIRGDPAAFVKMFLDNGRLMDALAAVLELPDAEDRARLREDVKSRARAQHAEQLAVRAEQEQSAVWNARFDRENALAFARCGALLRSRFPRIDWNDPSSAQRIEWASVRMSELDRQMRAAVCHATRHVPCMHNVRGEERAIRFASYAAAAPAPPQRGIRWMMRPRPQRRKSAHELAVFEKKCRSERLAALRHLVYSRRVGPTTS